MDQSVAIVLGALIAAGAGLAASWASLRDGSAARREMRRVAFLSQRAADIRELGDSLTQIVTAAQEIIWERVATDKPMPESDARAMRLTSLTQRSKFLRVVVGDENLDMLARETSSAAHQLSDSNSGEMRADMASANQALAAALKRVASLLRESEGAS